MAKLSKASRDKLPDDDFALSGRQYPIHDENHARAALTDVARVGSSAEKRKVRAAVALRYPDIDVKGAR